MTNDIKINIQNDIVNNNLDSLIYNDIEINKKDVFYKDLYNNIYQLSIIDNQKDNEYNNASTIKLDECENKLREQYNISKNISLLIFKMDSFIEGYKFPIIQYIIYNSKTKKN